MVDVGVGDCVVVIASIVGLVDGPCVIMVVVSAGIVVISNVVV